MKNFFRKIISKFSKYSIIYENAFDLLKVINFYNIDMVFYSTMMLLLWSGIFREPKNFPGDFQKFFRLTETSIRNDTVDRNGTVTLSN